MDEAGPRLARRDRRLEGVEHELGAQVVGHRPAHHPAAEDVEDGRQVERSLAGGQVGDVGDPQAVGAARPEVAPDEIGGGRRRPERRARSNGGPAPAVDTDEAGRAHQPRDPLAAQPAPPARSTACTRGEP